MVDPVSCRYGVGHSTSAIVSRYHTALAPSGMWTNDHDRLRIRFAQLDSSADQILSVEDSRVYRKSREAQYQLPLLIKPPPSLHVEHLALPGNREQGL